jgi:TDG/mug DNA glycosylase family protein
VTAGPTAGRAAEEGGPDPATATVAVYEAAAERWVARRAPARPEAARALAQRVAAVSRGPDPSPSRPVVADLGCGPGWHAPHLAGSGATVVGVDASAAMLSRVPRAEGGARPVRADLRRLPFRRGALAGAWASRSYVHVDRPALPAALAELHHACAVGAPVELVLFRGDTDLAPLPDDDLPGRTFSAWSPRQLRDVVEGAGFGLTHLAGDPQRPHELVVHAERLRTLADTVGPGMRLLVCGLNPSLHAADVGVGFTGPSNRFWPAAVAAGLVTTPFDARAALTGHGVGMTDLVKRATRRADELDRAEYVAGVGRLERLVRWLAPAAVCVVGLTGWRVAVDRTALPGVQPEPFGGRPVYLMGSTSGLNAHATPAGLADDLRAAAALAGR